MSKKINLSLETSNSALESFLKAHTEYLEKFVNYDHLEISANINKTGAIVNVLADINVVIPSNDLINYEEELAKLTAQEQKLIGEVARSTNMLNNPNFISRAPEAKVNDEKKKLENYKKQLEEVVALKEALIKSHE